MLLKGQKIIVIGGSRGIGLEITRALSNHGAKLIITGRSQQELEAAKTNIPNIIRTTCFDFANEMAVKQFFETVNEVDHLLLVAGSAPLEGEFLKTDISKIEGYFAQKFWGVVRTARSGIPMVKPKRSITFF
jgi:NAD(P)-dependent dehydrogenase (short-subunit alcohol dehydrogenase family)